MKKTTNSNVKSRNGTPHSTRAIRPAARRLVRESQNVVKDVQEMGGIATDFAQQNLQRLHNRTTECYEEGRAKVHDVQRTVRQYIQERPVKSLLVLVAVGVGLFFGGLWLRR